MKELDFVGKNVPRVDAEVKVTGEATFSADVRLPNMLLGRLVRSPLPHARILNIDTSRAERLPGVKAVIVGQETPFVFGVSHMDQTPLQTEKVRYVGDPVAAVAAVDEDVLLEAMALIKVDYEPLPAVFDPEEAMQEGAPIIHEGAERNIAANPCYNLGDVEKAFQEADHVFEDRFETQRVAHVCPEPHNCVAVWDYSGKLTFYYCSQMPSVTRVQLSKALGIPESKIRVITNHVGGGFGSRATSKFPMDFAAIVLARKAGRPVKIEYTRDEEFIYSTFRHKFIMTVKTGIKKDGTITGRHFTNICDNGAYSDYGPVVTNVGGAMQGTLYRFMNYRYDGYTVYTNLPYGGAMRGIGNPQVHYAGETQLNMIAERVGLDPLEIRLKNAARTGDETATGAVLKSCGLVECLEKVADKIGWKEKRAHPAPNRGLGIACGVHFTGVRLSPGIDADFAGATLTVNDDGSVNLATSCVDIGSGSSTALTQIAAEVLGIEVEKINTIFGDTETCPMGWGSRASRNTAIGGMAIKKAAEEARKQIIETAGEKLEVHPDDLDIRNSTVFVKSAPSRSMTVADVVRLGRYRKDGQAVMAKCHWDAPSELADPVTGRGNFSMAFSYGAKAIEVEVDPGTGQIHILEVAASQDLGKAINPLGAIGQIEGGVHMGLGFAMSEEIVLDDVGRMKNNYLLDYRTLTSLDMPPVSPILVETNDPIGPFGAKGVGEMATIGTPDALVSAVAAATGLFLTDLPITPEKVLLALKRKKSK
ncbi:MAG: molybdopterin-dependent oxidoreductase [Deltaproteobacteria bacterium]|nr:MAG: molybdopterin-dependent oxidoreductase [Deltaproteobacteria bacterium]